ncbi:hypothetical protein ANO11243_064070 [Dothideomycetidae sp. 11243]|nr:hypothetical protein ANO11243_064070 [fungal sp. No.11243]
MRIGGRQYCYSTAQGLAGRLAVQLATIMRRSQPAPVLLERCAPIGRRRLDTVFLDVVNEGRQNLVKKTQVLSRGDMLAAGVAGLRRPTSDKGDRICPATLSDSPALTPIWRPTNIKATTGSAGMLDHGQAQAAVWRVGEGAKSRGRQHETPGDEPERAGTGGDQ